jgi:MoxR-like ATPase
VRFEGTRAYVATDDLKVAVNAAITLGRLLLVKGEPGTCKTVLALEIDDTVVMTDGPRFVAHRARKADRPMQSIAQRRKAYEANASPAAICSIF